jgi:hypothetical protein
MDSQQAQLEFLKELILQSDREESRMLLRRLTRVEEQEQKSRRWTLRIASGVASLYAVVALATQGWGWLWRHSGHPMAVAGLWVLGIALFSLLLVGGCWLWHRSTLHRLIGDTQRFVSGWMASDGQQPPSQHRGSSHWSGVPSGGADCRRRLDGEQSGGTARRRSSLRRRR